MGEDRAVRNERLFREVNERIEELQPEDAQFVADFVCECSDPECTEPIRMTIAEYERVRATPNTFALVPGHETPEIERVVEHRNGYVVVEKT